MDKEIEIKFKQKKINHVFHYTKRYDWLQKILKTGFAPSYCYERISDSEFFIPMISFCNIPLKDVDNYMRYGKYGIGMSMEWAVRNNISPVIYIHDQTPFREFYHMFSNFNKFNINPDFKNMTVQVVQFLKNWKTKHKGNDIITYHEREWRYIPVLEDDKKIIQNTDPEFNDYMEKDKMKKPHFPKKILKIEQISDLRYITVTKDKQRHEILELLYDRFTTEKVTNAIAEGKLLILTADQLHNDF
ncbi:abortive infection system antitoxin AbiGi family protein [uncultured Draconibacterium sp.]|uniref:abortive infection system antitoxin AbiGi family protein n=1 Tax=uncultured Draconibacterium sp. TaxID=1573823 RepID=UPI0029C84CB1|nr:abortive infection system antitoxin AbiGi family protein [uncultured Draconibacterium sp.]